MLRLEKLESKSAAIPIDDDAQIFGRKFHAALGAICAFHVAGWREPEAPLIALARALGVTKEQAQLELTDTLPLARLGRLLPTVDAPPEIPNMFLRHLANSSTGSRHWIPFAERSGFSSITRWISSTDFDIAASLPISDRFPI